MQTGKHEPTALCRGRRRGRSIEGQVVNVARLGDPLLRGRLDGVDGGRLHVAAELDRALGCGAAHRLQPARKGLALGKTLIDCRRDVTQAVVAAILHPGCDVAEGRVPVRRDGTGVVRASGHAGVLDDVFERRVRLEPADMVVLGKGATALRQVLHHVQFHGVGQDIAAG